ncbi:MAG: alpha/beta fold hydrolase, partial [Nocardioidaceae bacterium]|nr:alpha/beta fold hydrolase [Nocardioidaceae bacterium]
MLVPGAGGDAWYWSRVVPELTRRGHHAIAVELPAQDDTAGLEAYVDVVVAAAAGVDDVVLVAQSMA